jgi:uracil-DNA glycosylase family 4
VTSATDGPQVRDQAASASGLSDLGHAVTECRACPRLVAWREQVARERRKSFADQTYWGRPVPGFGDDHPGILVVGLAPAAHGGNRTGRVFTGDRSGDWLFASLHRVGLANQAESTSSDDGLTLHGTRVVAAVRCAPPANKPTPTERDTCAPWLDREVALVRPSLRVLVALGSFAWAASLSLLGRAGQQVPSPRPRFGHGAEVALGDVTLLGCFHPSQQNTFTGKLTERMIDDVFRRAALLGGVAGREE